MDEGAQSRNKQAVMAYMLARARKDRAALEELLTSDFSHEMRGERQDLEGLLTEVTAFPLTESRIDFDALVEENDSVACRYRWAGTAPNGTRVEFTGIFIANMRDGLLASGYGEYDWRPLRRAVQ